MSTNPIRLYDIVSIRLDDGRELVARLTGRRQTHDGGAWKDEATLEVPSVGGGVTVLTAPFDRLAFEATNWNADAYAKLDRYRNEEETS